MFDFSYPISAGPNMAEGAWAASYAHLTPVGQVPVSPESAASGRMTREAFRAHVGGVAPGVAMWRSSTHRVISIAGAREPLDQSQCLESYGHPERIEGFQGTYNHNTVRWLQSLVTLLTPAIVAQPLPTWIFGYSWGGSAGVLLAAWLKRHIPQFDHDAVTFGMPRFADAAGAVAMTPYCRVRLMADRDPLPYIIPSPSEAPQFALAFPVASVSYWRHYRQLGNGVQMNQSGQFNSGELPVGVPLPIDVNIGAFIALNMGEGRPHNIVNYANTLSRAYPDVVVPPSPNDYQGHGLTLDPAPPKEDRGEVETMSQLRSFIHNRIVDRQSEQEINMVGAVHQGRGRVKIVRDGNQWYVNLDGVRQYIATSKRDARGAANALRAIIVQIEQQPDMWIDSDLVQKLRAS